MTWRGRPLYPVVRDLALKALSLGLERGSRIVLVLFAARRLGEAAFGVFTFASTVTAMLALAADLGLGVWTTRALARGEGERERVTFAGLTLRALGTTPYALAVAIVAGITMRGEGLLATVLLGVAAAFGAFCDHFGAIFRGSARFADEARLNVVRAALTLAGGGLALALQPSLVPLCLALAVAGLGAFVFGLATVYRLYPSARGARAPFDRALARAALREAWPIWLAGLLSLVYFKCDTFFVRTFAGDAELGAYGAAYKLFEGAILLPVVVLAATFPRLARLANDVPAQRRLERLIAGALALLGLVVGGALYVARVPLVALVFGEGFARAADSLQYLALGLPLVYVNFGLTHFLIARNRERVNLWLAAMMLLVTVSLDVWLVPKGSGPGAAMATGLAEVALTLGCVAALVGLPRATRSTAPAASRRDRTSA